MDHLKISLKNFNKIIIFHQKLFTHIKFVISLTNKF